METKTLSKINIDIKLSVAISVFLILLLPVLYFAVIPSAGQLNCPALKGDLNKNNLLDSTDETIFKKIISGTKPFNVCADLNNSGLIDFADLALFYELKAQQPPLCSDTDNGINSKIKGTITWRKSNFWGNISTSVKIDSCKSKDLLTEYFCINDQHKYKSVSCPKGCKNGACNLAVGDTKEFTCQTKPDEGTMWNTVSGYKQTWTGKDWQPAESVTQYHEDSSATSCRFKCMDGYTWNNGSCTVSKKIGVIFTYDNDPMDSSKIVEICDSQLSQESLPKIKQWFEKEAIKYNVSLDLSFSCIQQQISIPESMQDGIEICGVEGCVIMPFDFNKVSDYLRTEHPELQNNFTNIVIHYLSIPKQGYNIAANDIYIFTQPVDAEPFGLYGYSGRTIAHEIAHKLGASDKYGDINRACMINSETGQEYSGYDIMCHRIEVEDNMYFNPDLVDLLITDPTAKEVGWIK